MAFMCVCMCVRVCVRACIHMCMCYVRACKPVWASVQYFGTTYRICAKSALKPDNGCLCVWVAFCICSG